MSQPVDTIVQTLFQSLLTAIQDQLKYVCSYGNYIKDLEDGLNHIEDARKRVQEDVSRAERNAEKIHHDVTRWFEDAEKIIKQATEAIEKHKNSKIGCFHEVIPNPSTRFRIARLAEGIKQEIDKLQQRNHFPCVSHQQVAAGIVTGNYKGPEYWIAPSRMRLLEEISQALLNAQIKTVGIYGASGVGKSILLKQLEKQVQDRNHNYDFEAVTMAIVSRSPKWERVQDDLGYRLGLHMTRENSMDQKADRLRQRLSQGGKILIILDDIWDEIDLKKLGIPFDDDHPKIKLLLTSRNEQVLRSKMGSIHNFHLKRLVDSEAMDLFKQIVGDGVMDRSILIEQLAEKCAGLPVIISPLAISLKPLSSSAWSDALTKLTSLGFEKFIDKSLEFIYHLIGSEEAKSLFLLCVQIGRQLVPVDDLLLYGMGLGLLKGVHTIVEARKKVEQLLDDLKASCLLEDGSEYYVKLHDKIGDAAFSIALEPHTALIIRDSKMLKASSDDAIRGCKFVTLYLDDKMHELPRRLICPTLDMLLIYTKEFQTTHLDIPDAFFKDLTELKVLDLSDLIITSLPSSIQSLSKLHTLCLDRVKTEDLAIIGQLKTLQCLTFRGSKISRIPKEIGELSDLRLLDLRDCNDLQVIESDVLGRLIQLEELILPLSFGKWDAEGISNASLTELNNMSYLSNLAIYVPNATSLCLAIPFQQLVHYNVRLGWHRDWDWADDDEERTLKLEFDSSSSKLIWKEWLQTALKKTQDLHLHHWIGTKEIVAKLSREGFPELKHIHVESCPSIQYIIHSNQPSAIPVLETFFLCDLINLRQICKGDLPLDSLSNLKVIKIEACDALRSLFSFSLFKDHLPKLQEIEVNDCKMIQEIITYAKIELVDDGGVVFDKVEMLELSLHSLKLANLENISSFCSKESGEIVEDVGSSPFEFLDGRQVSFPCLESLTLCELPKLSKISHGQHPVNMSNLNSLELLKCKSLLYALDSNLLQQLKNLQSLAIEDCESMEAVFHMEELSTREAISIQTLQINLKLRNLPRLKKIWNKSPREISPVLELKKLEVSKCDELENLFLASMVKSLGSISYIAIASCTAMKEIFLEENDDQEIEFPSLSYLNISEMENLTMFSRGNHHYRFPCLRQLTISHCPKMRAFVSVKREKEELSSEDAVGDEPFFNEKVDLPILEKLVLHSLESMISIWDDNNLSIDSFCKLESIKIGNCPRIQSIFDPHLVERLQKLTKVKIESCGSLEVLFEDGHGNLKSRSREKAPLGFPNLRDVFVRNCCKLTNLFPHATARSLSELADLRISSCKRLVEVVSYDDEDGYMASIEEMEFYNLTSMQLENLDSLVHFCSGHYRLSFPFMKKLSIIGCMKLKAFILRPGNFVRPQEQFQEISPISDTEVDYSPLFDEKVELINLEELRIEGLEVKEIWPKEEPASFHMELKKLVVKDCHQLSTIVPWFMLYNLHGLEHLSVESCNSVEVIFELEKHSSRRQIIPRSKSTTKILEHLHELIVSSCESMRHVVATRDGDYSGETSYKTVILPQLSTLVLSKLPRLGNFCQKNHEVELPSLVKLEIRDCQATEVLVADSDKDCRPLLLVEKVGKEGTQIECSSDSFCKLKKLKVRGCENLLTVFPSKKLRAFHNLEELCIEDCESLESVFEPPSLRSEVESNNFDDVVSTAFALRRLYLKAIPRMKHVWDVEDPKWANLSFEKVETIVVEGCHSLKHLFPASVASCLKQLRYLQIVDCEGMEEIVWNEESANHQEFISTPSPESTNLSLGMHSLEWPSLETLGLVKCPNAKIFASVQQKVNIPLLESITLDASTRENRQFLEEISANPKSLCLENIKNQPWSLLLERFPNLRNLEINGSDSKEIFPSDNEKEGVMVSYLSRFLDIVENLQIYRCHHLTILVTSSALFRNLTHLAVFECNGLRYLVTSSVARGLVQLNTLIVSDCENIEEIVTYDCDENGNRANDEADIISFPCLKYLKLDELPKLRSFSSTSCKFNFPSLRSAEMTDVPKMHVFCEGDFICPLKGSITRIITLNATETTTYSFDCT